MQGSEFDCKYDLSGCTTLCYKQNPIFLVRIKSSAFENPYTLFEEHQITEQINERKRVLCQYTNINMNSINTDFKGDHGDPTSRLEAIAAAGFSHIQWIHHWNSDFIYTKPEVDYICEVMKKNNLSLFETHASKGVEKLWYSDTEYQRQAGVELVKNRMLMTKNLGGDVIVLHPFQTQDSVLYEKYFEGGVKSLKDLYKVYEETGVKIALENMRYIETYGIIEKYFSLFSSDFLTYCWDTGHSNNIGIDVFDKAAKLAKERLYALHLDDNIVTGFDEHRLPFDGAADWSKIAEVIACSPYPMDRPYTLEVSMNKYDLSISDFLKKALEASKKITALVGEKK